MALQPIVSGAIHHGLTATTGLGVPNVKSIRGGSSHKNGGSTTYVFEDTLARINNWGIYLFWLGYDVSYNHEEGDTWTLEATYGSDLMTNSATGQDIAPEIVWNVNGQSISQGLLEAVQLPIIASL